MMKKNPFTLLVLTLLCTLNSFSQTIPFDSIKGKKISDCTYAFKYFDFHYKPECANPKIIMIGNSLTRQGQWTTLLKRKDVINRGISGDNLICICDRLKYLKGKNAKIWFIEGGINDIPGGSVEELFNYYKQIVDFVIQENAIPVINLVFYISPKAGEKYPSRIDYLRVNDIVSKLNNKLIEYATQNQINYIDMNRMFSENNILKAEYTTDGVHLTLNAYNLWATEVKKLLKKHKI